MTQHRILITGAGGPAAIAFIEAAAAWDDVLVCAADMDPCAAGLYLVPPVRRGLVPPAAASGFAHELLLLARSLDCSIVIPTVDDELALLGAERERFERAGVSLLMPSNATLDACLDKWTLLARCAEAVPIPETHLLASTTLRFEPGEVWCAKPRRGSGSRGIRRVTQPSHLTGLPDDGSYLLQRWLPGREYSVDVVADARGVVIAAVPRLRMKVDSGVAVAARTLRDAHLSFNAAEVVRAIGLRGVANVQFREDAQGVPHLVEVNPRCPGTMPLACAAGVDMPRLAVDIHLGRPTPPWIGHREVAVTRRLTNEFMDPSEFLSVAATEDSKHRAA
jgi:carbamoyl-phosphate synthase large subunit